MRYVFSDCTLDTQRRTLHRAGERCTLRLKAFQLLVYLLEQRHRVVPKDELLAQVWPQKRISAVTLLGCIREVRRAIGDHQRPPRAIQTLHGYGYRFIAPVAIDDQPPRPPLSAPRSPAAPAKSSGPPAPPAEAPALDALAEEYKLVTVLCCAMAEASALAEMLGPESMHEVMQAWLTLAHQTVQQYEGTVVQVGGAGFTALFGAPLAQEDHARRAVLTALSLRQAFSTASQVQTLLGGARAALSIGLHTGQVVIGYLGETAPQLYTALSDTTQVATRLQQGAGPDCILLSPATYRLVRDEVQVSEKTRPDDVGTDAPPLGYAIAGLSQHRAGVPRRGDLPRSHFVGRDREMALLHERLARARRGQGQVVSLEGDAGIGKSRLLAEFCQSLAAQSVTYRVGHCWPHGSTVPYLPIQALLRQACGLAPTDHATVVTAKVSHRLQEMGLVPEEEAPFLLQLLDLPVTAAVLTQLDPPARKARTFTLLHQLHRHDSQRQPLILAVEDLHWIDATSEEYLTALVEQLAEVAVLLLVTHRPGYRAPWQGQATATRLALPCLLPEDSVQVVQSVAPTRRLPAPQLATIVAKASGNPFFLEELTWVVSDAGDDTGAPAIPDTIQAVLAARLDRLPATAKRLLQTVAVIGTEVSLPLLHAVTALPAETLQQSLQRLQSADFLQATRFLPVPVYACRHALVQEVAYQSLLTRTRRQIHARVAEVLTVHFPDIVATQPALLARHYTAAGQREPAVDAWQRAGERALERSAYVEARAHLTQGMAMLQSLPETPARAQRELALLLALGPVLYAVEGEVSPALVRVYNRARTLCRDAAAPQLFPVLYGLWRVYSARGEQGAAREWAEQLLELTQHLHDPGLEVVGSYVMGATLFRLGEQAASWQHLARGISLYVPMSHRGLAVHYTVDPGVACHCFAGHVLWLLGYPEQAVQQNETALARAQDPPHPLSLIMALYFRTVLCHFRQEPQHAQTLAETAMAYAAEQGFPSWLAQTTMLRGWARVMQGDYDTGMAQIATGVRMFQTPAGDLPLPYPLSLLIEALHASGQIDEALRMLEKGLELIEQGGIQWWQAELYRLRGELLLQRAVPDPAAAERAFGQALALARRQQAKSLELRAAMSLSRLWRRQGKLREAYAVLATVYGCFTEGFDSADLQAAQALLATF